MYSQEDADRMCRERQQYLELIHENIEYPYLLNEYRKEELDELVEKKFEGSLPAFIAAFARRQELSAEEIAEIRRIIEK